MIDYDLSNIFQDVDIYKNIKIEKIELRKKVPDNLLHFYNTGYDFRESYHRLIIEDVVMMSTDPLEVLTNQYFLNNSTGDVLVFGLGFGWIIFPLLFEERIKSIKIVEKNKDIIDFISPKIYRLDSLNKISIVEGDVYDWNKNENDVFDFIYFDTFETPQHSIFEMDKLKPLYNKNLKPFGQSYFWCQEIKELL